MNFKGLKKATLIVTTVGIASISSSVFAELEVADSLANPELYGKVVVDRNSSGLPVLKTRAFSCGTTDVNQEFKVEARLIQRGSSPVVSLTVKKNPDTPCLRNSLNLFEAIEDFTQDLVEVELPIHDAPLPASTRYKIENLIFIPNSEVKDDRPTFSN
ncbi:hypothetical protein [Spartinivicinus ruber]|uniref:hypothetical protein n=1 Tax=Spartinivicinus ruber TaxID=2683272 RepID=UPI0013D37223|nr:hypothetical protein [Spartinivicinus ruber]